VFEAMGYTATELSATDSIRPLQPQTTIEETVYAELRELIVSLELPPGTPLTQRGVAERLGVSPTPVRVAMSRLTREGLMSTRNGRRVVTALTREMYEEVLAARVGYEALAARLGAPAISDRDIEEMVVLLERLRVAASRLEWREFSKARWELHATCYRAANRPRLFNEVARVFGLVERYFVAHPMKADVFAKSLQFNVDFVDACRDRDAARAERNIIDSMEWGWSALAANFPSERDLPAGS
jgi:DNA-binding GntR family transcriptional regulator